MVFLISGVLEMTSVVTPLAYVIMIVDITKILTQDVVSIIYIPIYIIQKNLSMYTYVYVATYICMYTHY